MIHLKLLFVVGFISYGLLSVLALILEFPFIFHGGPETFLIFAVLADMLLDKTMYAGTAFEKYVRGIAGFVGTGIVWALFAIFVHSIMAWLDKDKHAFERLKRK